MNNKEIRDILASAFLDAGLTVRVVYARSTDSLYVTASDDRLPYTVRIANHRNSRQYSTVDDFWIDTTKKNLTTQINIALSGAAHRFNRDIPLYKIPTHVASEQPQEVSEECKQISDYSVAPASNLIDLATYYANEGYHPSISGDPYLEAPEFVYGPTPVPEIVASKDEVRDNKGLLWFWAFMVVVLLVLYGLH